jgi:hypothetical protein
VKSAAVSYSAVTPNKLWVNFPNNVIRDVLPMSALCHERTPALMRRRENAASAVVRQPHQRVFVLFKPRGTLANAFSPLRSAAI